MNRGKIKTSVIDFVIVVGCALSMFLIVNTFVQLGHVVGVSMSPSYSDGEMVMILKKPAVYERGDVVTFKYEAMQEDYYVDLFAKALNKTVDESEMIGEVHIKRIAGVPGDEVVVSDYDVYVNDELYETSNVIPSPQQAYILKEDEYFIVGDNANDSYDSRWHGPITKDQLYGKVITGNTEKS